MTAETFRSRSALACRDQQLRINLKAAASLFKVNRLKAFAAFAQGERFRDLARRIKDQALSRLPELLEQVEARIRDLGGEVHWAEDSAHARQIVLGIARRHGVQRVVKGKSMVTEEIGLNRELEAAGLEVMETDLGEFIIQLAGEGPSHIIAPAVHKNRHEIADLFADKLGAERTSEPEKLTRIARRVLRERFLAADMGITGANMVVADTGSVVLLENEGNIRLSTTLPRVHVAVATLEKVVPSLREAALLLALLPRSATGQTLSSYVSLITGARRKGERDGAEAFHLVLLDNGRSQVLADPELRDILRCLRCGSCLNVCPVYEKTGGHSYGGIYSGPMGSVLTPLLGGRDQGRDLAFACTQCGACAAACPVRIDLPRLHLSLRRRVAELGSVVEGMPMGRGAAAGFAWLAAHPLAWKAVTGLARSIDPDMQLAARLPGLGRSVRPWASCRNLPRFKSPFSSRWPRVWSDLASIRQEHGES